eukprot:1878099-Prymnesium_polylepis.1
MVLEVCGNIAVELCALLPGASRLVALSLTEATVGSCIQQRLQERSLHIHLPEAGTVSSCVTHNIVRLDAVRDRPVDERRP